MNCKNLSTSLTRLLGEFPGSVDKFRFSDVIAVAAKRPADSFILEMQRDQSFCLPVLASTALFPFPRLPFLIPLFPPLHNHYNVMTCLKITLNTSTVLLDNHPSRCPVICW